MIAPQRVVGDGGHIVVVDIAHINNELLRQLLLDDLAAVIEVPAEFALIFNEGEGDDDEDSESVVIIGPYDDGHHPRLLSPSQALELISR